MLSFHYFHIHCCHNHYHDCYCCCHKKLAIFFTVIISATKSFLFFSLWNFVEQHIWDICRSVPKFSKWILQSKSWNSELLSHKFVLETTLHFQKWCRQHIYEKNKRSLFCCYKSQLPWYWWNEPFPIIIAFATTVTFEGGVYDLKSWSLKFVCCHKMAIM